MNSDNKMEFRKGANQMADTQREEFEAWTTGPEGAWIDGEVWRDSNGNYGEVEIAREWEIWQAATRAALASRPAEVDDSLADAKRLDWLQSTNQTFCGNYSNTGFRAIGSSIWHGTLREAIDGAMIEAAPSHTTNKDGA